MKRVIFYGLVCLFFGLSVQPVSAASDSERYRSIAENFLKFKGSTKQIHTQNALKDGERAVGYVMELEGGGYILVPATRYLPPVKAYSLSGDFDDLPPWYADFLLQELKLLQNFKTVRSGGAKTGNSDKWDFLLNYQRKNTRSSYTPDTFLIKTKWAQGYPYNKKLPKISSEHVAAGCVQIAQAQLMKYHQHPQRGTGVASHTWNGQLLTTILSKNYHWENMPEELSAATPEHMQDELALLIRDLGIVNRASSDGSGTAALTNISGLIEFFGYANVIKTITNQDEDLFFSELKNEIDNSRPVLLGLPGHQTIADGYASDPTGKKFHINFGWNGHDDDFYYLNETIAAGGSTFDTTPPGLDIIYNIRPCTGSGCYSTLEPDDSLTGAQISGTFASEDDADNYEVWLKGTTSFNGARTGYAGQPFFIMVYDAEGNLIRSGADNSGLTLSAPGKYKISVSLKNENRTLAYSYNDDAAYNAYTIDISTGSLTDSEISAIENRDEAPVINNVFKDIVIAGTHRIRIDSADADGDTVSLSAASSDGDVSATISDDVLTLTPSVSKGHSDITITADANGKQTQKSFTVLVNDQDFYRGTSFVISGNFENQSDSDQYQVLLDGNCTITGNNGYANQAFFTGVTDSDGTDVVSMTDQQISRNFSQGAYHIGTSLNGNDGVYPWEADHSEYTLTVSCPDASASIDDIAELLGIDTGTGVLISGYVRDSANQGISGVTLTFAGAGSVITNNAGHYEKSMASGWSGTITPSKGGYSFTPASLAYTGITSDQTGQNYTGKRTGDFDCDNDVDLTDAVIALKLLTLSETPASFCFSDIDGDGQVGLQEIIYVLQNVADLRN